MYCMMSHWKHAIKYGFSMMVPHHSLDRIYVNFLIDNSLNDGSIAADQFSLLAVTWPNASRLLFMGSCKRVALCERNRRPVSGMYLKFICYYFQYKCNIWKCPTITNSTNESLHSCRKWDFRTFPITVTRNHKYI